MGTRADFYIGKNESAEWIGSIAWDGYKGGIPISILYASSAETFKEEVLNFLKTRDDATFPTDGWPWPWKSSHLTDCSYWFFDNKVYEAEKLYIEEDETKYNHRYWPIDEQERSSEIYNSLEDVVFPDMSHLKQRPIFGKHSGIIVIDPSGKIL